MRISDWSSDVCSSDLNSHIQGTNALGAMVVAGPEGWIKGAYRKFNIKRPETQPGDDFAMMREVFQRRFARAIEEGPERTKGEWPDLVLIDGGKGQVSAAGAVLAELGSDDLASGGVAPGADRHASTEERSVGKERAVKVISWC